MNADGMKRISALVRSGLAADDVETIRRGTLEKKDEWWVEALGEDSSDKLQEIAERIRNTEILIRTT